MEGYRTLTKESFYERTGLRTVDIISGGFPASRFPWLESKKVKGMTVTSGRKCSELSENLSRLTLSVRMYLESCELPGKQFVRTWSVRDTLSPFLIILKLRLSELGTGEKECSLWATPNTMDSLPSRSYEAMKRQATNGLWPTPTTQETEHPDAELTETGRRKTKDGTNSHSLGLADMAILWPTPTTRDYKDGSAESCKKCPGKWAIGQGDTYVSDTECARLEECDCGRMGQPEEYKELKPSNSQGLRGFDRESRTPWAVEPGLGVLVNGLSYWLGEYIRIEPDIPRVATGVMSRVQKLKCLGNAVMPQQAYPLFKAIAELEGAI